jgi:hypothetical protein
VVENRTGHPPVDFTGARAGVFPALVNFPIGPGATSLTSSLREPSDSESGSEPDSPSDSGSEVFRGDGTVFVLVWVLFPDSWEPGSAFVPEREVSTWHNWKGEHNTDLSRDCLLGSILNPLKLAFACTCESTKG